jgi:hypothetical protein
MYNYDNVGEANPNKQWYTQEYQEQIYNAFKGTIDDE